MKEHSTDIGGNKTGIALSPIDSTKLIQGAEQAIPSSEPNGSNVENIRANYIEQRIPVGTMPPPMTPQGVVSTAKDMVMGVKPTVLLDKLGERLAFERTGVRLYEMLIAKCKALLPAGRDEMIQQLEQIMFQEMSHFEIVKESIQKLGGDPTAMTPCADVAGVTSMGILQALSDPRTTVSQSLNAILVAEAADNEGWDLLIHLCESTKENEMAERFGSCRGHELQHLAIIRSMLSNLIILEIKGEEL